MRILYIDIDSLRPDHLGCYRYHRDTSPNIDRIAREGAVLERMYVSDSPCLPSRTAFFGGHFGTASGVVNHGGLCADLPPEGEGRDFRSKWAENSLASVLSRAGYWTASVSPFPRRHSAYQMAYGFNETIDTGKGGMENADEIFAAAHYWLERRLFAKGRRPNAEGQDTRHNAQDISGPEGRMPNAEGLRTDNWFIHVNMWDPHTPYDTPVSFGNPFKHEPIDHWITQELIDSQRDSYGPHSAREVPGYDSNIDSKSWPWGVGEIKNLADAKTHIDGYDCGVRYADLYIGKLLDLLEEAGVLEDTAIIVAADHGENLGELNVWGDHQTADEFTNHIPCIIRWPGVTAPGSRVKGLCYHLDLAATIADLAGAKVPDWNGLSMASQLRAGSGGREALFLSQGAWSLQRSARWENWILIHTIDTGMKNFSEWMLFDLTSDPHETANLANERPDLVKSMGGQIMEFFANLASECPLGDPFDQVAREGGPYHAKVHGREWRPYLERLRKTGRATHAQWLETNGNAPHRATE